MDKFLAFFTKAWYWIRNPSREWFLALFHLVKDAIVYLLLYIQLGIVLNSQQHARRQEALAAQKQLQLDKAFQRWRDNCRNLLKTPATMTKLPYPPSQPCSNQNCQDTPLQLGICTHVLKHYYKRANLNQEASKKERNFWHPNGRRWSEVAEGERIEAKAMAEEVSKVLLELLDEKKGQK